MRKIPTYHFSDDFSDKLTRFTADFIAEGFKLFENEFAHIDSFVTSAKNDVSERSDHQLRCSEKERYLLEMVSYKIYDQPFASYLSIEQLKQILREKYGR